MNMKKEQRHKTLTKAVKEEGYQSVVGRLNLVANYNKNTID